MKLSYEFDLEDWTAFQRYHFSASPTYRRMRNYTRILFPVAALFFIFTHYQWRGFDPIHVGVFAVISTAWFIWYPRLLDYRTLKRSRQFVGEGKSDSMFGRRELELLPDNVHTSTVSGEATYRASAITKVVETKESLLLYVSAVQAVVIPRRRISADDFRQASAFACEHYARQVV